MPEENEYREEPYSPPKGTFHAATNLLTDNWGRSITQHLGASHAWVLSIVERLIIGYQCKARRVSITELTQYSGLGRERVYEVLEDLEATDVIALKNRQRGRKPLIVFNLDWRPTSSALAAGERVRRERIVEKTSSDEAAENGTVSSVEDDQQENELPAADDNQVASHSRQPEMFTVVGNQLLATAGNNIQSNTKGASPKESRSYSNRDSAGSPSSLLEKKERNPTPPLSESGKETTSTTSESLSETNSESGSQTQDASLLEGSEEVPEGWRHLDKLKDSIPPDSVSSLATNFAEKHARTLNLKKRSPDLARVVEYVIQTWGTDSVVYLEDKAEWCASKVDSQNVLHPWPYFLTAVVEEISDVISFHMDVSPESQRKDDIDEAVDLLCRIRNFVEDEEIVEAVIEAHYEDVTSEHDLRDVILEYSGFVSAMGGVANPGEAARHLDQYLGSYPM